jgi:hypothetical protein
MYQMSAAVEDGYPAVIGQSEPFMVVAVGEEHGQTEWLGSLVFPADDTAAIVLYAHFAAEELFCSFVHFGEQLVLLVFAFFSSFAVVEFHFLLVDELVFALLGFFRFVLFDVAHDFLA